MIIIDIKPFVTIDCFWLAAGKWPLESLANFYLVELGEKVCEPTEAGQILQEIDLKYAENLLPLPYHKKALELFMS